MMYKYFVWFDKMNFKKQIKVVFGNDGVLQLEWSGSDEVKLSFNFGAYEADEMRKKFGIDNTEQEFYLEKVSQFYKTLLPVDPKIGRDYSLFIYNRENMFTIVYQYVNANSRDFTKLISLFSDKPNVTSFY